ncbi:hypothetical protein ANCCAN_11190 [Ancylostoma caninum]|uniref:Uncharacterized protein n=1 Tax=Ancylostoma caninum TaxID=29170 RepID=A0A368GEN5_ANCCA|nr:hypothetical protein ANCCAN_11190 [Ancylostoma caninum]
MAVVGVINKSQILMILCMICNIILVGLVVFSSLHWEGVKTFSYIHKFVVPSIIGERLVD